MKNTFLFVIMLGILCILSAPATAGPLGLIDDFSSTSLSAYTKTVILDQALGQDVFFQSTGGSSGVIQAGKTSGTAPEQVVLLRDDYNLGIGETLRVDASVASISGFNCDFGIALAATATPPEAVYVSSNVDTRENFLNMYIKAGSSGWGTVAREGTTQLSSSGFVTGQDLSVITGLFISRTGAKTFDVGYTTSSGDTVYKTHTYTNATSVGAAVGFYADIRGTTTYGNLDNLRIVPEPSTAILALIGVLGMGILWLRRK